jgi:hypothetical protein
MKIDDHWDPEEVGSIWWVIESDGNWKTGDHNALQGDTIETVEIGDFEKLLAMYREVKGKYEWLRTGART